MKKILLTLAVLALGPFAFAAAPSGNEIPLSSFSVTGQPAPFLFSSATIQLVGVTITSPAANGKLIVYFSTSANYFAAITTKTIVNLSYQNNYVGNQFVPLFDIRNTSYTYLQKIGDAITTIWLRCMGITNEGVCPGVRQ